MEIKPLLKEKGLTKKELAQRIGVLPGNLNQMLRNPTEESIRKIALAMNIPVYQLFYHEAQEDYEQVIHCPHCGRSIHIVVKESE